MEKEIDFFKCRLIIPCGALYSAPQKHNTRKHGLCNIKVVWFGVCINKMGVSGLKLSGSLAISERLIRGDQVVSSTGRSQDS